MSRTALTQVHAHLLQSVGPETPAEAAARSPRWEWRGLLRRLVRAN